MRTGWPESGHRASLLLQAGTLSCAIPVRVPLMAGEGAGWATRGPQVPAGLGAGLAADTWSLSSKWQPDLTGKCCHTAAICFILSPHLRSKHT